MVSDDDYAIVIGRRQEAEERASSRSQQHRKKETSQQQQAIRSYVKCTSIYVRVHVASSDGRTTKEWTQRVDEGQTLMGFNWRAKSCHHQNKEQKSKNKIENKTIINNNILTS